MIPILIKHGTLLTGGETFKADVLIRDGRIAYIGPDPDAVLRETDGSAGDNILTINAQGKYVAPGFIDMHTHGGGGKDFMDGDMESYRTALRLHGSHGTTLLFPTTLSSTRESLFDAVRAYRKIKAVMSDHDAAPDGAAMGGLHLEGPYFAMSRKGAQDPRYIRNPDPKEYMALVDEAGSDIARWSLAPELPGALEMARRLSARGVVMAMGHTDATFEECEEAFKAGFTHMTHFFSCMSSIVKNGIDRKAGVVEYGYYNDDVTVEIIGDGVHVPASMLKLVYKLKGPLGVALVTDSVRPAGLPEGYYKIGTEADGMEVLVEDGVAKLADRSALAGSVATMDMVVRTVHKLTGLPLEKVVQSATETPARIMGLADRKGLLKEGHDADVIILDDGINVSEVIIGGRLMQL